MLNVSRKYTTIQAKAIKLKCCLLNSLCNRRVKFFLAQSYFRKEIESSNLIVELKLQQRVRGRAVETLTL